MHLALWVLAAVSLLGAVISMLRPAHVRVGRGAARAAAGGMTLRIGEIAERSGVTPRTIRYYEELGLLPRTEREQGKHRIYTESDVERLREVTRLRDLLGLSLDELRSMVTAEAVRAEVRRRFHETDSPRGAAAQLLDRALPHIDTQLGSSGGGSASCRSSKPISSSGASASSAAAASSPRA